MYPLSFQAECLVFCRVWKCLLNEYMDFGDLLVTIIVIASSFFKGNFFFTFPEIIYLLIYLFVAVLGLCCYEGSSLVVCTDFLLQWFLLLQSVGSRTWGFKLWPMGSVVLGSRARAQQSCLSGFVSLGHVGSSWIRGQTHISFIVRGFFTTEPPCPLFLCHSLMKSSWINTSLTFFLLFITIFF